MLGAVETWSFLPARQDGRPVGSRIGIVFQFPQPFLPKLTARVHEYKETGTESKDRAALPLFTLEPEYPPTSIGEGSVILNEIVDREGHVTSLHVVRDLESLTAPTVAAVKQWKFAAGRRGGEDAESDVIVTNHALLAIELHPRGCERLILALILYEQNERIAGGGERPVLTVQRELEPAPVRRAEPPPPSLVVQIEPHERPQLLHAPARRPVDAA